MWLTNILVPWYLENKRELPWRKTSNPYYIWLSEIILQQTRVDQGMAYYLSFVENFPTVNDLANSEESRVLKLWQGLGYYSRARNLHFSAKYIVNQLEGQFPKTYKDLLSLKGVGDYTASAVSSICFDEPMAVVDGNVYRVLSRIFGVDTPINSTKGIKEFKLLAQELLDVKNPGDHNQAMMEFGAVQCKPQNPNCTVCPVNNKCVALAENKVSVLPVKDKKVKVRKRYFNYLVMQADGYTQLNLRTGKGIWQGLYEFPCVESTGEIDEKDLMNSEDFNAIVKGDVRLKLFRPKMVVHKLSHQHIYTKFWLLTTQGHQNYKTPWEEVLEYPVPVLIHNFLKEYLSE
ncbi:MAG: A/G-specific adenine glycosylase [Flavobacteriaceae bacterium]|nr:MAG: A/G-specific adenine glycosylase [Flavobacteriaceae bacterium]